MFPINKKDIVTESGEFIKINPEDTTRLNPLELITENKKKEFFQSSLKNLFEIVETLQGDKLTQQERDVLYEIFVKNNNIIRDTNISELYKELLLKENKGDKGVSRLIKTFKDLI
ncbi:hypothetical protein AB3239_11395 [Bacillus subtilis]|uniref:hypothetical protein n=1 Tax=Bacillus subtilis TaxID=1423 RepID=UPI003523D365